MLTGVMSGADRAESIRVAIADDHPVVRTGLRNIIDQSQGLQVVAEIESGDQVAPVCAQHRPHVLLLDASMPGPGLFAVLRGLREGGSPSVLVLSFRSEQAFAHRALAAGAMGYISKERPPTLLVEAIRAVARGETWMAAPEAAAGSSVQSPDSEGAPVDSRLSPREFEIFLMLGSGLRVADIASQLELSPKTVSTHRARILAKTGLETNAGIVSYVADAGLLRDVSQQRGMSESV